MYKVIKEFHDLLDEKTTKSGTIYHHYEIDDEYPRKGLKPSETRIQELAGSHNAQGEPLIAEVGNHEVTEEADNGEAQATGEEATE